MTRPSGVVPPLALAEAALLHRAEERWLDTARARLRAAEPRSRRGGRRPTAEASR